MKHQLLTVVVIGLCIGIVADAAQVTSSDSPSFAHSFRSAVTESVRGEESNDPGKLAERWAKLWTEKQLDALIEMYAADGVFLTGQGARISGRESIRALFKTAFDAVNPDLKIHSIASEQSGSLAYDSGEYTESLTPVGGGPKREGKGNYVMVLKRQRDGKWLIIQHVWTDVPAEPPN